MVAHPHRCDPRLHCLLRVLRRHHSLYDNRERGDRLEPCDRGPRQRLIVERARVLGERCGARIKCRRFIALVVAAAAAAARTWTRAILGGSRRDIDVRVGESEMGWYAEADAREALAIPKHGMVNRHDERSVARGLGATHERRRHRAVAVDVELKEALRVGRRARDVLDGQRRGRGERHNGARRRGGAHRRGLTVAVKELVERCRRYSNGERDAVPKDRRGEVERRVRDVDEDARPQRPT